MHAEKNKAIKEKTKIEKKLFYKNCSKPVTNKSTNTRIICSNNQFTSTCSYQPTITSICKANKSTNTSSTSSSVTSQVITISTSPCKVPRDLQNNDQPFTDSSAVSPTSVQVLTPSSKSHNSQKISTCSPALKTKPSAENLEGWFEEFLGLYKEEGRIKYLSLAKDLVKSGERVLDVRISDIKS